MTINKIYSEILPSLESDKRVHLELKEREFKEIYSYLEQCLESSENPTKGLMLLSYSSSFSSLFDAFFLRFFATANNPDHLIMALNAFNQQVLERKRRSGNRLTPAEILSLKQLLKHPHYEVVEWTLRIIETLGQEAKHFTKDLRSWSSSKLINNPFNKNYKNIKDLINYIIER